MTKFNKDQEEEFNEVSEKISILKRIIEKKLSDVDMIRKEKDSMIRQLATFLNKTWTETVSLLKERQKKIAVREKLSDSLNLLLNDLWEMRSIREKGFKKLLVLILAVTKDNNIDIFDIKQRNALAEVLRTLKKPNIIDLDIENCIRIMNEAGLDFYKPLIKKDHSTKGRKT